MTHFQKTSENRDPETGDYVVDILIDNESGFLSVIEEIMELASWLGEDKVTNYIEQENSNRWIRHRFVGEGNAYEKLERELRYWDDQLSAEGLEWEYQRLIDFASETIENGYISWHPHVSNVLCRYEYGEEI